MRSIRKGVAVRRLAPAALLTIVALAGATVAAAGPYTAGAPVQVPDNPLGASPVCAPLVAQQTAAGSVNYPDAEVEPYVASNPANPNHLVASFQQDRWNDGGSNGLTNVVSFDGGATWPLAASQPSSAACEGATSGSPGFFDRATDPWTSFSSDGKIVYSICRLVQRQRPRVRWRELDHHQPVDRRRCQLADAGHGHLDASTTALNDKESVTADSLDPTAPTRCGTGWSRRA